MKHSEKITENETLFETGERLSYMRYDSIAEMSRGQAKGFKDQAEKDNEKGYKKLTKDGRRIVELLEEVANVADGMWKYSEPRMSEEDRL